MKITADGYRRNVVGDHTLTNVTLDKDSMTATADGVRLYVHKSRELALSGEFHLRVYLTVDELQQALHCATIGRLEKKIQELEAILGER